MLLLAACAAPAPLYGAAGQPSLVFFEEWSAAIDGSARATLSTVAQRAKAAAGTRIVITAFADPGGSAEANADVTRLRARRVSDTLEAMGIPASRIERRAMGGVAFTGTALESRRVEITIVAP
jgi:K(+)-stimulated pyrophosphate-energized sodium pump